MDQIRIIGGQALHGSIRIGGAKNASLPLMAACLLSDEPLELHNLPHVADITTMVTLLSQHGASASLKGESGEGCMGRVIGLHARDITSTTAPYDIVRKMRASVLVLGPLLAREGVARVSLPGGCAIGTRPVNYHIQALEEMGAEIEIDDGYIDARAPRGLQGAVIRFPEVSVGASENILMAATLARGETILENVAREPEVTDLANCLLAMGARIEGVGSDLLRVTGVDKLHAASHTILPDRVEAATYAMAAGITGGDLMLLNAREDLMDACVAAMQHAGVGVEQKPEGLRVFRLKDPLTAVDITTQPYPGFATDMQAQMMAMLTMADGASLITENLFENRFMHVPELSRMGADITIKGASAMVRGVPQLTGAQVMATDLRASVSLVLAGLAAKGETLINRVYHLDRGYELLEEKLANCGARIERVRG